MNRKNIVVAFIVSAAIGCVFTLGQSIIFGGGVMYLYDEDYKIVDEMTYFDANDYLLKRATEISGFESFLNGVEYPRFWVYFAEIWLYYTLMCLLSCIVFVYVSKRMRGNRGIEE